MNTIRYLTFEVNQSCINREKHTGKCPISHPERYRFSKSSTKISDQHIFSFWRWCVSKGFRGIILWHMYNEPALSIGRIRNLMEIIKSVDPQQPFQITTSIKGNYHDFDIVKISDYNNGAQLDDRIKTNRGEGKPYNEMPSKGWCGRGRGWEILIDNFGNWCLCCNDWRCEESVGSICNTEWDVLYDRWKLKRARIKWEDEESYKEMPRMCRSCLDKNPSLHKRGGI
jgi:hypothetical protein